MMNSTRTALQMAASAAVLIAAFIWLSGGCHQKIAPRSEPSVRAGSEAENLSVPVEEVRGTVFERTSGTIASARHTTVSSNILARIESITVRSGSEVKEGDILVRLDRRDLEARVGAARQAVSGARATLDLARSERDRVEGLWASNVASMQQLEQARARHELARSAYDRAREQLRDAEVAMSHAEILSPVSGRVVDRLAEPGDTAAPGAPLLRIYDPGALRLEMPVRESLAIRMKPGDAIRVHIEAVNRDFDGTIDEIVPYAEPGARTFLVKVRLAADPRLFSGMFGRADVPAGERTRLLIPQTAVRRIGQLEYASVVRADGSIERRLITTGPHETSDRIEVLSGLSAGEYVLVASSPGEDRIAGINASGRVKMIDENTSDAAAQRARAALAPLKSGLRKALQDAMASGGPMSAIDVCRERAPTLASESSTPTIRLGRTSHRVRNPENAPKPWMRPLLDQFQKMSRDSSAFRVVRLTNDSVGYVEPIYIEPLCTVCHGTAVEESLLRHIREAYPEDEAIGFETGDLRGLFWVEIVRAELYE
jgi:RND family efflux transporter MFP subunit